MLVFAFGIAIAPAYLQAQTSIAVGNVSGLAGSSVLVPIQISGGENASALQFTLQFDADAIAASDESPLRGEALQDHVIAVNRNPGKVTFVIFSGSLSTFEQGEGTLVSLILDITDGLGDGSVIPLSLVDVEGADEEGSFVNVLGVDGELTIGEGNNTPAEGQNGLIFPQIANGTFEGGDIAILLVFVNRTTVTSNGEIRFFKSDGSPFSVTLIDGRQGSDFALTVPAGGSAFLATDGSGDLSAGYARLISTAPLGGTLVFTTRDANNMAIAEAGVGSSSPGNRFSVPILVEGAATNTGIAAVNFNNSDANFDLILKDSEGVVLAQEMVLLGPGEHLPRFATELFDIFDFGERFEGSIEITSDATFSAVALKTQGSLLTTFPVIPLP